MGGRGHFCFVFLYSKQRLSVSSLSNSTVFLYSFTKNGILFGWSAGAGIRPSIYILEGRPRAVAVFFGGLCCRGGNRESTSSVLDNEKEKNKLQLLLICR